MKELAVGVLRVFIVAMLALLLLVQALVLPVLAGEQAEATPQFAHLRLPLLAACIAALACVQVVLVCTWRLLTMTRDGEVFTAGARPWVHAIIAALAAGALLGVATGFWLGSQAGVGPITVVLGPIVVGAASGAAALLMGVMRALLVAATANSDELAQVV